MAHDLSNFENHLRNCTQLPFRNFLQSHNYAEYSWLGVHLCAFFSGDKLSIIREKSELNLWSFKINKWHLHLTYRNNCHKIMQNDQYMLQISYLGNTYLICLQSQAWWLGKLFMMQAVPVTMLTVFFHLLIALNRLSALCFPMRHGRVSFPSYFCANCPTLSYIIHRYKYCDVRRSIEANKKHPF